MVSVPVRKDQTALFAYGGAVQPLLSEEGVMLKASIIGNLGSDPELRYSASGSAFLRMNIASNYRVRAESGEWQDRTEWVRVTVFGQRAESLSNLLKKGARVYVDGRLEARPWTDQQGAVRAGLELTASDVEFMSGRQDDPMTPRNTVNRQPQGDDSGDLEDAPF
jgi:single-strand DNA-binding protein